MIERVREVGLGALGHAGEPHPLSEAALDALRFPSGAPLSPALREWLAFDASMLGWFEDLEAPSFAALDVAKVAEQAYGPGKRSEAFATLVRQTLPGHGYLLPRGRLARRFLYVGDPDSTGEPPVLVFDVDGPPYVGVEHPGFDVWLGFAAGLVAPAREVLGGFADDERFAPRMKEHAERLFLSLIHIFGARLDAAHTLADGLARSGLVAGASGGGREPEHPQPTTTEQREDGGGRHARRSCKSGASAPRPRQAAVVGGRARTHEGRCVERGHTLAHGGAHARAAFE